MPRKSSTFMHQDRDSVGPNGNGATVQCAGPVQPAHERPYGQFCPKCEYKSEFFTRADLNT